MKDWMLHISVTIDHRLWFRNFRKRLYDSLQSLTHISTFPVAIIGIPPTNIKVNKESALTFCICLVSLLSFRNSVDLDQIGIISFINFFFNLVEETGGIVVTFMLLITAYSFGVWFQGVSSLSSCWYELMTKTSGNICSPNPFQIAAVMPLSYKHLKERD